MALEGFVTSQSCTVSMDTVGRLQTIALEDHDKRPLRLTVNTEAVGGAAIKASIENCVHIVHFI